MTGYIVACLVSLFAGAAITVSILYPKLRQTEFFDKEAHDRNVEVCNDYVKLLFHKRSLQAEIEKLENKIENVRQAYKDAEQQFEEGLMMLRKEYKRSAQDYEQEYLNVLKSKGRNYD